MNFLRSSVVFRPWIIVSFGIFLVITAFSCKNPAEAPRPSIKAEDISLSIAEDREDALLFPVRAVSFSADGECMLSVTEDGFLRVWELYSGRQTRLFENAGAASAAVFNPGYQEADGIIATTSAGDISFWAESQTPFSFPSGEAVSLAWAADGSELVTLHRNGELRLWAVRNGARIRAEASGIRDFTAAVLGTGARHILYSRGGRVFLAETAGGKTLQQFPELSGPVLSLALSMDGGAAAAAVPGEIVIWNTRDGSEIKRIAAPGEILSLAFNDDSTRVASGGRDGSVRMWSVSSGLELVRFVGFNNREWISLTSSGYYNASPNGAALLSIQIEGENFNLSELSETLMRQDKYFEALTSDTLIQSGADLYVAVKDPVPRIEITGEGSARNGMGSLDVRISAQNGAMGRIQINRIESTGDGGEVRPVLVGFYSIDEVKQRETKQQNSMVYEARLEFPLRGGKNTVGISVLNRSATRTSPMITREMYSQSSGVEEESTLHIALVAISTYKNHRAREPLNLKYPLTDAEDIAALFSEQHRGRLCEEVVVHRLSNEEVTKKGFNDFFRELKTKIKANDTLVLFFAGHGKTHDSKFFFVPWDWSRRSAYEDTITHDDIIAAFTNNTAKNTLVLLDTCESGTLVDTESAFGRLIAQLNQKAVITAAAGDQSAFEGAAINNGVFTSSIKAAREHYKDKRFISVKDLIDFVQIDVPERLKELYAGEPDGTVLAAARTIVRNDTPIQEPMAHFDKDFELWDRNLEKGRVTISVEADAVVNVLDLSEYETEPELPEDSLGGGRRVAAGTPVVFKMKEKSSGKPYTVSFIFSDGSEVKTDVPIENDRDTSLKSNYLAPILTIKSATTGNFTIQTLSGAVEAATSRVDMTYPDGKVETKNIPIQGLAAETLMTEGRVEGNGQTIVERLPPGMYQAAITYANGRTETQNISLAARERKEISFNFQTPGPGSLTIRTLSDGNYAIRAAGGTAVLASGRARASTMGIVDNLNPQNYTVTMNYPDGRTERRTVTLASRGSAALSFTYRIPVYPGLVIVPGGNFVMGSPRGEANRSVNEAERTVTLDPFYIGRYTVTQKEYSAVMNRNPSNFRGDNLPVEQVTWFDAVAYCNALSIEEGLTPAYTIRGPNVTWNRGADGYRLPTEAEWEYACRAGTRTSYNTGTGLTKSQANYGSNATQPVGRFNPNAWGLYDMHGNVWEWCWDYYAPDYNTSELNNPAGPAAGQSRVVRGGSWRMELENPMGRLRSAYRGEDAPRTTLSNLGFRVVRPVSR